MNRSYEQRTLKQIIKLLDRGGTKSWGNTSFKFALYIIAALAIAGSYILVARGVLSGEWGVFISAFGGVLTGVASYFGIAMKQWPVIRPYIDRKRIEQRLDEIET